jgi:hypothetical protein
MSERVLINNLNNNLSSLQKQVNGIISNGITGATGATGPAGTNTATGATGATGPTGVNGSNGTNGIKGDTGATGANGAIGPTGANGEASATGATGATGHTGANGANGAIGATGANGANGAIGPTGANGSNGAIGATGATGDTGATGPAGANGSNGTSLNEASSGGITLQLTINSAQGNFTAPYNDGILSFLTAPQSITHDIIYNFVGNADHAEHLLGTFTSSALSYSLISAGNWNLNAYIISNTTKQIYVYVKIYSGNTLIVDGTNDKTQIDGTINTYTLYFIHNYGAYFVNNTPANQIKVELYCIQPTGNTTGHQIVMVLNTNNRTCINTPIIYNVKSGNNISLTGTENEPLINLNISQDLDMSNNNITNINNITNVNTITATNSLSCPQITNVNTITGLLSGSLIYTFSNYPSGNNALVYPWGVAPQPVNFWYSNDALQIAFVIDTNVSPWNGTILVNQFKDYVLKISPTTPTFNQSPYKIVASSVIIVSSGSHNYIVFTLDKAFYAISTPPPFTGTIQVSFFGVFELYDRGSLKLNTTATYPELILKTSTSASIVNSATSGDNFTFSSSGLKYPDNTTQTTAYKGIVAGTNISVSGASNNTVNLNVSSTLNMNSHGITNATMTNPFVSNPSTTGQVLSSTTAGVLSWITPPDPTPIVFNTVFLNNSFSPPIGVGYRTYQDFNAKTLTYVIYQDGELSSISKCLYTGTFSSGDIAILATGSYIANIVTSQQNPFILDPTPRFPITLQDLNTGYTGQGTGHFIHQGFLYTMVIEIKVPVIAGAFVVGDTFTLLFPNTITFSYP